MQTGYNDIDVRCDAYLTWIDDQRSRRILFDGTTNALDLFTQGALGIANASVEAVRGTALALGLTRSVFDAYQSSILFGLEGSTIKEIVNERRRAHRESFQDARYATRPDAIYALRTYLSYCTPQSILTDVNALSRGAARGETDPVQTQARRAAEVVAGVPRALDPAGAPVRPAPLPEFPEVFDGPGFNEASLLALQRGSCIAADGDVGPATRAAVQILERTAQRLSDGDALQVDGRIQPEEWELFAEATLALPCDGYQNLYEKQRFGQFGSDDEGRAYVQTLVDANLIDAALAGRNIVDPDVRSAIRTLSSEMNIAPLYPAGADVADELTPELDAEIRLILSQSSPT